MLFLHWLAAFASGLVIDVLATVCFHYTARNGAYRAATVNAVVEGCSLFVFVDVSRRTGLAVPYLMGLWIGGVLGVKLKARMERPPTPPNLP